MTNQQSAGLLLAEYQAKREEKALNAFYEAERNAGAHPLLANERLHFHAKYLDEAYERDLEIIKACMERTS